MAYRALKSAGMSVKNIAKLAGVSDVAVYTVLKGTYKHSHRLDFNGGMRVIQKLMELQNAGMLQNFDLDSLRTFTPDNDRPVGVGRSPRPSGENGGADESRGTRGAHPYCKTRRNRTWRERDGQ